MLCESVFMRKETGQHKSIADRLVAALELDEFVLYSQSIVPLWIVGSLTGSRVG
jgi:hypothetical protein